MTNYFLTVYDAQSYIFKKKTSYLCFFLLMMLPISLMGIVFHGNHEDLAFYISSTLFFSLALYFLRKGQAEQVVSAIVAVLPLFIFADIMRFEFTSYEKIVETMMESFLAYLAVALFSLRKEHIIYTVALNTLLTILHALLITQLLYQNSPLPPEGYKYFVGGASAVLLAGLLLWFNFKINEESLRSITHTNEQLERIVQRRTESLELANLELERTNRELYRISTIDSLTMVYNRRKILDTLLDMMTTAHQEQTPLTVVMIDIDNFKSINDTYGHSVGDMAIRMVVDNCKQHLHPVDSIGRLGGEEFLLVLNNKDLSRAIELMDQIRSDIEASILTTSKGIRFNATISVGMAQLKNHVTLEELIHDADEALYTSKRQGKNRITVAT